MDKERSLEIHLDARSPVPVYEQVKQGIRAWILSGGVAPQDRLPAIRDLARRLRINPNTVVKVYYQLQVEGFIEGQAGTGYFVRPLKEGREVLREEQVRGETRLYLERMARLGCGKAELHGWLDRLWGEEDQPLDEAKADPGEKEEKG